MKSIDEVILDEHRQLGALRMLRKLLDRLDLPESTKQIVRLTGMEIYAEGIPLNDMPPHHPATYETKGETL